MQIVNIVLNNNNEPFEAERVPSHFKLIAKATDEDNREDLHVFTENLCMKVGNTQHLTYLKEKYSNYKLVECDIDGNYETKEFNNLKPTEVYYLVIGEGNKTIYISSNDETVKSTFKVPSFRGKYYYNATTGTIELLQSIPSQYTLGVYDIDGLPFIYDASNVITCPICGSITVSGLKCKCEHNAKELWDSSNSGLKSYDHTPTFKTHKLTRSDSSNKFGMELEMVGNKTRHPLMVPSIKSDDFVYFMSDGSLPNYGFEQATHPFTYDYYTHHRLEKNNDIFHTQKYKSMGIKAKNEDSCGLHVHIDKDNFSNDDHYDVWFRLMSCNVSWLEKICGRSCGQYKGTINYPNREKKKLDDGGDKYLIIANRSNTIEFRLFNGDLDMPDFAIQFLDATINYTRGVKEGKVFGWTRFKKYLKKNIDKYPALKTRFIDNKVPKGLFLVDNGDY